MLEFRGVTKTYKAESGLFTALDDLSFFLAKGEFAAVIGPSGSGKSTLLHLASGLDSPSRGAVFVGGQNLNELTQGELCDFRLHHVGFVFQAYNLFPALSAVENVEYTARIRGDGPEVREKAIESMKLVGLGDKIHERVTKLSGGQQQRVAVARALTTEPAIIFADEPTANLDSRTAGQLIELFEKLNGDKGITFLFSTHDTRLMDKVHRRLPMSDGKLQV
jgi:putative ABC transport system ATP-binding protein